MTQTNMNIEDIVEHLRKKADAQTMEEQLLRPKLIRELYKQLGAPKKEDFKEEFEIAGTYWKKIAGYTTGIGLRTEEEMKDNNLYTNWRIHRASETKMKIVERYTRAGWGCDVQAYNVVCDKYVKHPKYKDIWVRFYSSRDCNKYEYVIEVEK